MKKFLIWISTAVLLITVVAFICLFAKPNKSLSDLNPEAYEEIISQVTNDRCVGPIENMDDVISKAKQIFVEIYGEEYIKNKEPLTATYNSNTDAWTVHCSSKPSTPNVAVKGGGINIKIRGSTGEVIAFWIDK